jgi:hypothetical protein
MAEEHRKTSTVQLNGDHLVQTLRQAGLDPEKLDLRKALPGGKVDIEELQSRLRSTGKGGGGWHVTVTITHD